MANDEFCRAATDVDDQPLVIRGRQTVGDTDVDKPRFFPAGDCLNGIAQYVFGFLDKHIRVFGDPQCIRAHHAYRIVGHSAQSFGKQAKCGERALCRRRID